MNSHNKSIGSEIKPSRERSNGRAIWVGGLLKVGMFFQSLVFSIGMFVIFLVVIIPTGLILKQRRDPLLLKRPQGRTTYWIKRPDKIEQPSSITKQF